jgi:hypothetical protein
MKSMNIIESKSGFGPDQWLWCLHCQRFFQGRDARFDGRAYEGCAFADCGAAGYQVDIHDWDTFKEHSWPQLSELKKGLSSKPWEEVPSEYELARKDPVKYGIGAALNQDWRRREEILGVSEEDSPYVPTDFSGADITVLQALLAERFAPLGTLGRYASIERVIDLMHTWPQLRAGGIAIHHTRGDYRVSITTLECALESVDPTRRDELIDTLEREFGEEADIFVSESTGRVELWWICDAE